MNTLFVLFLTYILAPKIDLISASGSGIRPEDLISVLAVIIYLLKPHRAPLQLPRQVRVYITFITVGFVSAVINYPLLGLTGLVYATRLAEYLVWFPIMYEACRTVSPRQVRLSLLAVSTVLVIWGGLELVGVASKFGKFVGASERLTINTSGPFETSVMLAMLAYAAQQIVLTPTLLVMVVLTQSRITLVGMVASFVAIRPGRGVVIAVVGLIAAAVLAGPVLTAFGSSRLAKSATPVEMAQQIATEWDRVTALDDPSYFRSHYAGADTVYKYVTHSVQGDLSFKYRAIRWPLVVKSTLFSPLHAVIGWAPGAWGPALDSYFVRVFGETGFAGAAVFVWWLVVFIRDARRDSVARFSIFMLIVVAVFIDIFASSKVMPILWAFAALDYARHPAAFASPMLRFARPAALPPPRRRPMLLDQRGRDRAGVPLA